MCDFEKKAEEYGRKKHKERMSRWEEIQSEDVIEGFQKGAEFGYNYALNDTEAMLKSLKDKGVIKSWYYNGTYHVSSEE